jgi:hypothetical protein
VARHLLRQDAELSAERAMKRSCAGVRVAIVASGLAAATAVACSPSRDGGPLVAREHIRHAPPPPARVPGQPLVPAPSAHVAPPTNASPIANASVDAVVLVITANGTSGSFGAIVNTLQYLGTPFRVLNATTDPQLTAGYLSSGTHGNFAAVFLDIGDLSVDGDSAFLDAEWTTLATYEASFGVRRVSLFTSPTPDYGLSLNGAVDPSISPISASCTSIGRSVFVGTNCDNPVHINQGFAYPSSPTDAMTIPLLVDAAGNVYAATLTYADGREALALTFAQASFYVSYLELGYGLVDWATRGLFVGERHSYAVPQIDDLFLYSNIFGTTDVFRISDADLQAFASWLARTQAQPLTREFRPAWAANGQGSQAIAADALTSKAVALGSTFSWLNHTWDHADLTALDYADTLYELTHNDQYLRGLGLVPYATINAVTPNVSGLANPEAMQAMHDLGITQIVSDTSAAGQNNPSPNAGVLNALQPGVLEVPRIPSELYYNVSQPSEWIPEYESLRSPNATVDYATIIGTESDALSTYMLNGRNDPWMFHQANARNYDGAGHSLLSDLLDASFAKYGAVMTLPIVSPTMDELAGLVRNRMALDASGVVATIVAGASMTVRVTNAATVPVTGLCTPGAESYAGQTISYLQLGAGQSMTYSLTSCNSGAGGGGAGGVGGMGAGGTTGAGAKGAGGNGAAGKGATGAGAAGATGAGGTGAAGTGATGASGATGAAGNGAAATSGAAGNGAGGKGAAGNGAAAMTGETGASGREGGGSGGAGEETGAAGGGGVAGGGSVSTGGHSGGPGGAGEAATGGNGGHPADAGASPPNPTAGGCSCALDDDAPGPGAFLFSLLGGGLAFRDRGRPRRKPAAPPPAAGSC